MRNKHKSPHIPQAFAPALRRRQWITSIKVTPPVPRLSAEDFDWLQAHYKFRHEHEVVEYLRKYPFLVEVLVEMWNVVQEFFWQGIQLVLEVERDYEYPEDQTLFAMIQPPQKKLQEAWQLLNKLDDVWWLKTKSKKAQNRMSMMVCPYV